MRKFLFVSTCYSLLIAVILLHPCYYTKEKPVKGVTVVKEHHTVVDFACVVPEPYYIFVEPPVHYAPATDVKVVAPAFAVEATANSPPGNA